jgi:hypothetical protein
MVVDVDYDITDDSLDRPLLVLHITRAGFLSTNPQESDSCIEYGEFQQMRLQR